MRMQLKKVRELKDLWKKYDKKPTCPRVICQGWQKSIEDSLGVGIQEQITERIPEKFIIFERVAEEITGKSPNITVILQVNVSYRYGTSNTLVEVSYI